MAPSRAQARRAGRTAAAFLFKGRPPRLGGPGDASTRSRARRPGRCGGRRKRALRQTCSREDPENAICVQRLDDSLNSAIRTRYRILLRSSSMHKPRDPPLEVVSGSNRPPQATSQGTTHDCHGPTGKKTTARDPRPRLVRARHARWRAREELGRAPQGRAGDRIPTRTGRHSLRGGKRARGSRSTVMILPQVHLRKPCYYFYFL